MAWAAEKVEGTECQPNETETTLILEESATQAEAALEISEHSFNPEAFLVPGDRLFGIVESSAEIPDTIAFATNDYIDGDWFLATILDR